eukprot:814386-Pyramimonas_sp.AAC.1
MGPPASLAGTEVGEVPTAGGSETFEGEGAWSIPAGAPRLPKKKSKPSGDLVVWTANTTAWKSALAY